MSEQARGQPLLSACGVEVGGRDGERGSHCFFLVGSGLRMLFFVWVIQASADALCLFGVLHGDSDTYHLP